MENLAQGLMIFTLIATAIGGGIGVGLGFILSKILNSSKSRAMWNMIIGAISGLVFGFFSLPLILWFGYNLFG